MEALELRIKELEEDNNALSERVEETLLLRLINESFEAISDERTLLGSVLEKISIIKNIPYCACYEISEENYNCAGQYCSYLSHSSDQGILCFSSDLFQEFKAELPIRYDHKDRPGSIQFITPVAPFSPNEVLVIPFHSRRIKNGIFIFISNGNSFSPFDQQFIHFNQIIQIVTDKWDRISLQKELHELNQKLERRVQQRTRQLSESEDKYRQIFNMASDAISLWELDDNGKMLGCLQANAAAVSLTGYSEHELRYVNPFETLASFYTNNEKKDLELLMLQTNASFKASFEINGKIVPLEVNTRRFQMDDKPVVIAVARDVSERQAYEEKLIEVKNKAIESERLKSAFLANMSHEIRTPMNAIVGFSELLSQDKVANKEVSVYANIIFKNSMHLLNLIDDIVDCSKIEANQVVIVNNEVNVNELISDISVNMISILHNASKNHIDVLVHKPLVGDDAVVLVDGTRLHQILANLVNNAIKFTFDGFIEIGYKLKGDKVLEFYVRDTGIGIAIEDYNKVFERFVQVRDEKIVHPGGTGLGLAICSNLLEKMDGHIWLESEPKKGTTFYFTIPYNRVDS